MQVSTSKRLCKGDVALELSTSFMRLLHTLQKNAEKIVDLLGIFMSVALSLTRMNFKESATESERGSSCRSRPSGRR